STLGMIARNDATRTSVINLVSAGGQDAALQAAVSHSLTDFLDTEATDFTEYYVYDAQGVIIASTSDQQVGKIIRLQPYFVASLKGKYIQPPYYEIGSNKLGVIITEPLMDDNGALVGVLAGRLNMDGLAGVMAE